MKKKKHPELTEHAEVVGRHVFSKHPSFSPREKGQKAK